MIGKRPLRTTYETLGDRELLSKMRDDDRDAFACIYKRYHGELYTFAMKYLKNRHNVEDTLQHVFVKLWTIREAIIVTSNLRGYLFTMTKHIIMNFIRNSNNALQLNYKIAQLHPQYDDDLYMHAERHHAAEMLTSALSTLPPQQRTVASLRCEGYSNEEIAKKMNLSIHTVNTHYRECLKTLKAHFGNLAKLIVLFFLFR